MQPNQDNDQWKQPIPQAGLSPYAAPVEPDAAGPVVTLAPDVAIEPPVIPQEQPEDGYDERGSVTGLDDPLYWQAEETINKDQNAGWYIVFGVVVLGLMALAIFVMQSWTFAALVPIMATALVVYVRRPPAVVDYTLSSEGLYIGQTLHSYEEYRSFGVLNEQGNYSVMLVPRRRMRPASYIYFPEDMGEIIVDTLAARIPMQDARLDWIDRLLHRLHI